MLQSIESASAQHYSSFVWQR